MTSNDEQHGRAVLAPLSDLGDPPPPAYNIAAAVGTGRRRRRRRRIATVAGIAAVTALAVAAVPTALSTFKGGSRDNVAASPSATPAGPALPTSCELHLLPEPDGMSSSLAGTMDPTGRFVAGSAHSRVKDKIVSTPVLWQDGRPQLVGGPNPNLIITDVNSQGVAIATSRIDNPIAWIYRDGKLSRLSTRPLMVNGINERGDIVGQTAGTNRPFVMRHGRGEPVELPLPPGTTIGGAEGVDDDGTVVGYVAGPNGSYVYLWFPDGKAARAPLSVPSNGGFYDLEIRNGWVVGSMTNKRQVFRWNIHTGAVRIYPQLNHYFGGVNRHGWVVGPKNLRNAILISDAGELVLPGVVKNPLPMQDAATAVADDGRTVAGHVTGNDNEGHAAVWRCS